MKTFIFNMIFLVLCGTSKGSQLTSYGLGAANMALGNSTAARPMDAYSQAYNPALMTYLPGSMYSFSVAGAFTSFEKINQVVTNTPALGANSLTVGDVSTKTPDTFMVIFGMKVPLKRDSNSVSFGLFIASPVEKVIGVDTEDTFVPQYSMYLSDTQHFNMGANIGFDLGKDFSLGLGGQLYLVQAATTRFVLPSGGNSTGRIKMDVRPGLAPNLGLIKSFKDAGIKVGFTYWGKQDSRMQMDVGTIIGLIGPTELAFTGKTSVAFDPETYILSASYESERDAFSFSGHLEKWGAFSSTVLMMSFQSFQGSFSQTLPPTNFKDTVSLHGGYERKWSKLSGRLGLAYVPTPVTELNGDSNFVDSDKYQFSLGLRILDLENIVGFKSQLDLAGLVHYLLPRNSYKYSSQIVGAPGYKIGGTVFGYGVTFTTEL